MKNKKSIILIALRAIIGFIIIYFIGWFLFGGKRISIDLNFETKQELINKYEINGVENEYIVSFEYVTYLQKRACVLKIQKNDEVKKILELNKHIEKIEEIDKISIPYPNVKYIPHGASVCCYYDNNYYYLSVYYGGNDYNKNINNYFWELYNNETSDK